MREIVVLSGKGGAGKTTITASLNILAQNNVAGDVDVEAANLQFLLGLDKHEETKAFYGMKRAKIDPEICINCGECVKVCQFESIIENHEKEVHEVLINSCEGCATCQLVCPVDAIEMQTHQAGEFYRSSTKSGIPLFHANLFLGEENTGMLVAEVRKQIREYAETHNMDWMIIDGPPGTGCPATSTMTGADFVILAVEASLSGISDFERVLDLIDSFRLKRGVIINKYDINPKLTSQIEKICNDRLVPVLAKIPYDRVMQEALAHEVPIVKYAPNSKPALALISAWEKLQDVIDKDQSGFVNSFDLI